MTETEVMRVFDVSVFPLLCVHLLLNTVPCTLSDKQAAQSDVIYIA